MLPITDAELGLIAGGRLQSQGRVVATITNMKPSLGVALVYNALGVPLAAGVRYPFTGLLLSPMPRPAPSGLDRDADLCINAVLPSAS